MIITKTSGRLEWAKGNGRGEIILPFGNGSFRLNLANYDIIELREDAIIWDGEITYFFKFVPRKKEEHLHMKTDKHSYGKIVLAPLGEGGSSLEYNLKDYDISLLDFEDNGNLIFKFTPKEDKNDHETAED